VGIMHQIPSPRSNSGIQLLADGLGLELSPVNPSYLLIILALDQLPLCLGDRKKNVWFARL